MLGAGRKGSLWIRGSSSTQAVPGQPKEGVKAGKAKESREGGGGEGKSERQTLRASHIREKQAGVCLSGRALP